MFNLFSEKKETLKNLVEICVSNRAYCDSVVYDCLVGRDDVVVKDRGCNSYCEICDYHFYAFVNGELISEDSANELLEDIEEELKLNSIQ
ncbi:DUF1450 domain-containing protein [Lysinibacillus sp. SGAir0095]|uniref:DUF1450 domain-containing protein n=1 Tax=Lysinibacillus sp. SGAir0095 TaxID=2070463 RepID=UPI0010CD1922|nr:DUF1450 domain-containing protein [Lysinibacillus sp. SGAir0095]QCR31944.1 hypothetical protein C1N55_07040 [Lysinibacillus sp. SGAir0095]